MAFIAGRRNSLYVCRNDGVLFYTGFTSETLTNNKALVELTSGVKEVDGWDHTMIVKQDGSLWGVGTNYRGQLGNGKKDIENTEATQQQFVKILDKGVKHVSCGGSHTVITKQDGSIWGAGANDRGELGTNDNKAEHLNFVQILPKGNDVKEVVAGCRGTLLLKEDGSVFGAGAADEGAFGNNIKTDQRTFVKIMSGDVKAVAKSCHTLLLKIDGSVWGTGLNQNGQVGDGSFTIRFEFFKVIPSDAQAVAAGYATSMVIKGDGSLWMAGRNDVGQQGDGGKKDNSVFVKVISSGVKSAALAYSSSAILKVDGTVWTTGSKWGLGDGSGVDRNKFVKVPVPCGPGTFRSGDVCTPYKKCGAGEWTEAAGDAKADTKCKACSAGTFRASGAKTYAKEKESDVCTPHKKCGVGEWTEAVGDAKADTKCKG